VIWMEKFYICNDCGMTIDIPIDVTNGEVLTCPNCGLEYEVTIAGKNVVINEMQIEGEDWGE